MPDELIAEVSEELNVRSVEALDSDAGLVDISIKANYRALGARFAKDTPAVAKAITAADPIALAHELRTAGATTLSVDGGTIEIGPDDVLITESPREGWAVASDAEESVAIDLTIDDDLRRAGLAREVIRVIQEARKTSGFEITDRIIVTWSTQDADMRAVFNEHGADIAAEVLAIEVNEGTPASGVVTTELPLELAIERVAR